MLKGNDRRGLRAPWRIRAIGSSANRGRQTRTFESFVLLLLLLAPGAAAAPSLATGPLIEVGAGAHPHAAVLANGGFVVVWEAAPDHGPATPSTLHARLFDAQGAPIGREIELLRPVGQLLDGVAALPTGFVVVWEE